ncbi:MAG: HAD family hydrolase [Chloroflexi bacterium]|nr:MAG: HAD family hydrolase [Chloroflexota bacterium]
MVPMVVGDVDAAQIDRLGNAYGEHYRAHEAAMLKPMSHAVALLDQLAEVGIPLAIVTNRVQPSAEGAVAALGWSERFAAVVGSTVTPLPKPAADPARYALERLGISPSEAAYVGDNEADALCAAAAGIPLVVLVGAESQHAALTAAGATHTVISLETVADLLLAITEQ